MTDKIGLEKEAKGLREKMLAIEKKNICLKEENSNLQSDLNNLVQVCHDIICLISKKSSHFHPSYLESFEIMSPIFISF